MGLYLAIAFALGLIVGLVFPHKTVGVFKVDHTDPKKDVYRLELDDLSVVDRKSRIILRVDHNAKLSQE